MNLKRLLNIAQEADKNGNYVTADKVTNLLKTAQGQYSVTPSQNIQSKTNTTAPDYNYNNLRNQYITKIQNNAQLLNSYMSKQKSFEYGTPEYAQLKETVDKITNENKNTLEALKQDKRLTQQQKDTIKAEGTSMIGSVEEKYKPQQNQQMSVTPRLSPQIPQINQQMSGMPQMSDMPQMADVPQITNFPQMTMPQRPKYQTQPQMTDEQKLFADFRNNLKGPVYQANQVARQNAQQPRQYVINEEYRQPVYEGTNTEAPFEANPNTPSNLKLYGSGYASMALKPQTDPQT